MENIHKYFPEYQSQFLTNFLILTEMFQPGIK